MTAAGTTGLEFAPGRRMSFEEFLADPSTERAEWVNGAMIPMVGVSDRHAAISAFLVGLLSPFTRRLGNAIVRQEPYLARLGPNGPVRSPDLMVLTGESRNRIQRLYLDGPPDFAIEIVSPGTADVDYGAKYLEYEAAGVREYWIIDPERQVVDTYVLSTNGRYEGGPHLDGIVESHVLPGFRLELDWLWNEPAYGVAERALGLI